MSQERNKEYIEELKGQIDELIERHLGAEFFGFFRFTIPVQGGMIQNIKTQVEQTHKISN